MGISISIFDGAVPRFPFEIKVAFECDECIGLENVTIQHSDGFIGCHKAAMDRGWLERNTADGRTWHCPACSGK